MVEERLTNTNQTSQMPQYSPDGKKIAFFENRASLKILDLKTKATITATDGKDLYSYSDGDIWFSWSPDSVGFLLRIWEMAVGTIEIFRS